MDTRKLRQKILDLAIHGKLVPQDPNDEPASVLLERIKAEKERLIQEGKIKRNKKSTSSDTPHYANNVPFEVPKGWVWTTLGDIFTLQAGKNITAKDIFDKQDTVHYFPCYGGNGLRGYVSNYNRDGRFPLIGRQGALCGNINEANGQFYATEHAVVVDTFCETNIDWAINVLLYLNLNQYATSTAQPGLSVGTINEVMIPVPPIEEQKRISQSLSKWFTLVNAIEVDTSDLYSVIKQAKSQILDLAIHGKLVPQDPNDEPASELLKRINPEAEITCDNAHSRKLPQGWCCCPLENLFTITMGQSPSGDSINQKDGVEFHQGKIQFTEKYLSKSLFFTNTPTKIAVPNSILLCVRAPVGVINITERQICIGRGLCSLHPISILNLDFAFYSLSTYKSQLDAKSTGTTFKAISGDIIKKELFYLPPYQEQQRIVQKIEVLFSLLNSIQETLEA